MAKRENANTLPIYIADAFTKKAFAGNGAAVCLLPKNQDLDGDTKQKIGREMNLSETAFVKIVNEGDTFQTGNHFALQWYTPKCEVSLCGHATLATSAVLFKECNNVNQVLQFETKSGILKAKKLSDNRIEIDLPAYQSNPVNGKFENLIKATVGQLPVEEVVISHSKKLLIRLHDDVTRAQLEAIAVNDANLLAENIDVVGIIVSVKGGLDCVNEEGNKYDFISRYFAPWMGISEDPVTGSAHSVLAPYWAGILGKTKLYARQCSLRGGDLHLELLKERVLISGDAVIVVKGYIQF